MQRSAIENRCLHKGLTEVANQLQAQGIERKTIVEDLVGYEAPITMEFLKEIFKTIIFTMYGYTSTTQLESRQMQDSWDVLNKFMGEEYGITATWPSQEAQHLEQLEDNN